MEPYSEAIDCDNSLRFSEKTFICMMIRIVRIVFANGLPTAAKRQWAGIIYK